MVVEDPVLAGVEADAEEERLDPSEEELVRNVVVVVSEEDKDDLSSEVACANACAVSKQAEAPNTAKKR